MGRRGRSRSPFSLFSFQDIITCVSGIIILITLMLAIELSQRKAGSPRIATTKLVEQLRVAIADTQEEVARLESTLRAAAGNAVDSAGLSNEMLQHDLSVVSEQVESLNAEIEVVRNQENVLAKQDERLQAKLFDRARLDSKLAADESAVSQIKQQLRRLQLKDRLIYNARTADGKQVWLVQVDDKKLLVAAVGNHGPAIAFSHNSSLFRQSPFANWLDSRKVHQDFFFVLVRPNGTPQFSETRKLIEDRGFSIGFDLIGPHQVAVDPQSGAAGS